MKFNRLYTSKAFAIFQLVVILLLVVAVNLCCESINISTVDFCWLLDATSDEFPRAFPDHHRLVFFTVWSFKYLLPFASITVALFLLVGRQIKENLLLVLFSTLLSICLAELILRMVGYQPGQFNYSQWVEPVDSLFVFDGFVTDANGLTKVDTELTNRICESPEKYVEKGFLYSYNWDFWSEIGDAFSDHGIIPSNEEEVRNEFWKRQKYLLQDNVLLNRADSMFLQFASCPFNLNGFYSIPFDTARVGNKRILLLGDSFTWGHSAENITSSFANTLLARGYTVYNTGFSGADVPQYHAVLKQLGPKIQPTVVVVNFFMGNDVSYFKRIPKAGVPFHYHTNAGAILSNQFGVDFLTAQDAYDNVMKNMVIPQNSTVNRMYSKTVISTLLWEFLVHYGLIDHNFFYGEKFPDFPITIHEIRSLKETCDSLRAKLILSVIPSLEKGKLKGAESIPGLFGDVPYHQPVMTAAMYNQNDGHFNDEGHLVYANYLEKLIKAELEKTPLER